MNRGSLPAAPGFLHAIEDFVSLSDGWNMTKAAFTTYYSKPPPAAFGAGHTLLHHPLWAHIADYLLALVLIAFGWVVRLVVGAALEGSLPPFVTFFPAVMVAAMLGGAGPTLFATALAGLTIQYGLFAGAPPSAAEIAALIIFYANGALMAGISSAYHRQRAKAAAYERGRLRRLARAESRMALQASENRYRLLVEQAADGIFVTDARGRYLDVNPAGLAMLGYAREELLTMKLGDVLAADELARIPAETARLAHGDTATSTWRFRRKDGSSFRGEVAARLLPDGRVQALVRDVTERKLAEERLNAARREAERANDAKSRFLAAVSHDLRQPLSALSIYVGTLRGKLAPPDRALAANMKDCVGGLNEMLSNLLDLSRLEAGVISADVRDFALDAVLHKVLAAHAPDAEEKGLALRYGYFGIHARTDPVLLHRIVGNFVANAIRYTERGGVLVGCRRRGGKRWLEVWDTGIGIPADKTDEIFEEFRQLGREREGARGAGVGLAVVAKTAALLGLEVRVRSRLGKGSMFAVEIPLGAEPQRAVARRYVHRPLRVAVVEDDARVAHALAYSLRHFGHQVAVGSTAAVALAALDGPPDIVIADYRLGGGKNGLDVVAAFRARYGAALPALLVTSDTGLDLARAAAAAGVRVLHKPVDVETVRAAMAELALRDVAPLPGKLAT